MKYTLLILLFFNCIIGFCQDTLKTNGYTVFKYENGNKSSEGTLINGKPDNYWRTYYQTGILKSEGNRKNFDLDSLWKFYNEKGKLILEINYSKSKKNGIKTTYTDKEIIKENYINDIKDGITSYYYPDEKLRLSVNFIKGREQGIAREYSPTGEIITIYEYKKGYLIGKEKVNRFDNDSLKTGKWVKFYDNGKLQSEYYYKAGVKEGYFKEYDIEGNLINIVKYINGEIQKDAVEVGKMDIKTEYYSNGQIKYIGSFKNNIPEGVKREYSEDGKIINSKIFKNGVEIGNGIIDEQGIKQGPWKDYYESGELKDEGTFDNGAKIGLWKFYFKNKKLEQTGNYLKNEKPDGEWKWYYDNGTIMRTENYSGGLLNGTTTEYSDSGTVIVKGEYVDGLEEGFWFYKFGDIRMEGSYKEGRREGIWTYYFDNGNVNFVGNFFDDNPDGKHIFYWDNGKVREEGYYVMGVKEGEWYKNNYDGSLFLITTFKNGIEIKYDGVKITPPLIESTPAN
ncbi:MAG: toxin-antitoxin system YwqK family antitoxin [Bacteroidetes bacterium]|nr:toxin-antitoxin system YwqK family antitoxin [Bacteroidota bacterium]